MEERIFNPETDSYPLPDVDKECYCTNSVKLDEVKDVESINSNMS